MRHSVDPIGNVLRLTVAVLVDGKPGGEGEFEAWDAESIEQFEELARHAVGFSEERGDRITITNAPFRNFEVGEEVSGGGMSPGTAVIAGHAIRALGLLVALFLLGKLVVKPLSEALRSETPSEIPERLAQLEARLVASGALQTDDPEAVLANAAANPDNVVAGELARRNDQSLQAIRGWLRES